jgi:hypothetical protein
VSWKAEHPEEHEGRVVHNGQCVRYVQECAGLPHTSHWRRGVQGRGNDVETGTAIATFDPSGHYGNHTDGRSHAAIFIAEHDDGLRVWDQWRGHPVQRRTIYFRNGVGKAVNDGDRFFTIEEA